jgi:WD40 repeat protein/tRNA A-37 threonylcarbamoyl transferase component Bud32
MSNAAPSEQPAAAPQAFPTAESATLSVNNGAPAVPSAATSVPGYEILGELGRGGMGVVYKARQTRLNRLVALKMILAGGHAGAAELLRFQTEAHAIARLQHPNIVQVYEVGEHEGKPFLSLEYCGGGSLAQKLGGTPLPPRDAAALLETLARAMRAAHEQYVIHRDLKPANVLLASDGTPKITDFGLAKELDEAGQTQSGTVLGTPSYMAPEQAGGKSFAISPATDVYALGAILYECLTGRPPFKAATAYDTILQVLGDEPVPPARLTAGVPRDVETICLKCLAKEPGRRYASAKELGDDLRRFLAGEPIVARPVGRLERTAKWVRRNPVVALLCGVAAGLLLTLTAVSFTAAVYINGARKRADQKAADEKAAREEADAAATAEKAARRRAQERLIRLNVVTGNFLSDAGDYEGALLRYSQAWLLDRDEPAAEPIHRLRLACVLERGPRLEGICFHTSPVLDARVTAAGDRVLTRTEDGHAFLWDTYRSRALASPLPHDGKVLCAALSPDGTRAVTTGTDGTARLWDTATGEPQGAALRHPDAVHSAAFSADGQRLATACADGMVRFWTVPGKELIEPVIRCGADVRFVGFSPDDRLLVTVDGNSTARVWDPANGNPLTPPLAHRLAPGNPKDRLFQPPLFSPNSARLLTAVDRTVRVCNANTGGRAISLQTGGFGLNRAAFSPDGSRILVVGQSERSLILDAANGRRIVYLDHPREVQAGCWRADGQRVATASSKGLIHVRDARTGKEVVTPFRHVATVTELAFTPAGDRLLSVSLDGTVRIWSVGFEPFKKLPYDYSCGRADRLFVAGRCLSPDGLWEVHPDGGEGAHIQRRGSDKRGPSLAHPGPVRKALFAPDGQSVLTADDHRVQVWEAATGRPRGPVLPINGALIWAQFSDDGGRLMLINAGGNVNVHETSSGRRVFGPIALDAELQSQRKHFIRKVVALSPDGRRLAVHFPARTPPETQVYEVDTGRSVVIAQSNGYVASLAFSPNSREIVSAASDTLARVWDAETGKLVGPAMRHPSFVRKAAFGPDGRLVVTNDDKSIRLWDSATGDLLTPPLPNELGYAADLWVSRDGRRIVGVAPNGLASQWELPTFRAATDRVLALVQLLTGQQVDGSDGIAPLEPSTFREAPEAYRRAWLSWRGLDADPAMPSSAGGTR